MLRGSNPITVGKYHFGSVVMNFCYATLVQSDCVTPWQKCHFAKAPSQLMPCE